MLQSLTRKELLPLYCVLLIVALIDLSQRLIVFETQEVTTKQLDQKNSFVPVVLTQDKANSLIELINEYERGSAGAENNIYQGMSEADQLAQQGDLSELFFGDFRYRLVGLFNQTKRFAVILQENLASSEITMIRVEENNNLGTYLIEHIENDNVAISRGDKKIHLYLYKNSN